MRGARRLGGSLRGGRVRLLRAFATVQRLAVAATAALARRARFALGQAGHRVYVLDPAGRIILRYAPDADPRGILKDMERLLRYAWAG